jgi:hypothetical protein
VCGKKLKDPQMEKSRKRKLKEMEEKEGGKGGGGAKGTSSGEMEEEEEELGPEYAIFIHQPPVSRHKPLLLRFQDEFLV